ncbi:MAG: flagellar hook-length control protein FliK [FCB group bacterium]|nr:flagellar hook-length control protein FliK [FCB group bacterium]
MNTPTPVIVKILGKPTPKQGRHLSTGKLLTGGVKKEAVAESKKSKLPGGETPFAHLLEKAKTLVTKVGKKSPQSQPHVFKIRINDKTVPKAVEKTKAHTVSVISGKTNPHILGLRSAKGNQLTKVFRIKGQAPVLKVKLVPDFIPESGKATVIDQNNNPVSKPTVVAPNSDTAPIRSNTFTPIVKDIQPKEDSTDQKTNVSNRANSVAESLDKPSSFPFDRKVTSLGNQAEAKFVKPENLPKTERITRDVEVRTIKNISDNQVKIPKEGKPAPNVERPNRNPGNRSMNPLTKQSERSHLGSQLVRESDREGNRIGNNNSDSKKPTRPTGTRPMTDKPGTNRTEPGKQTDNSRPGIRNEMTANSPKPGVMNIKNRTDVPTKRNKSDFKPELKPGFINLKGFQAISATKITGITTGTNGTLIKPENISSPRKIKSRIRPVQENTKPAPPAKPENEVSTEGTGKNANPGSINRPVLTHESTPVPKLDFWIQSLTKQVRLESTVRQAYLIQKISQWVEMVTESRPKISTQISIQDNRIGKVEIEYTEKLDGKQITIAVENESVRQQLQKIVPLVQENLNQKGQSSLELFVQLKQETEHKNEPTGDGDGTQRKQKSAVDQQQPGRENVSSIPNGLIKHYGYNTIEMVA